MLVLDAMEVAVGVSLAGAGVDKTTAAVDMDGLVGVEIADIAVVCMG